ncbi:hypothetical protein O3P69_017067 [Scylla paramamosain]|uniref:Uncharacterized protein n=1 Tax=Scylla paramamosain TaxID=85552 RepID=A0AAW0TTX8_SCYPA
MFISAARCPLSQSALQPNSTVMGSRNRPPRLICPDDPGSPHLLQGEVPLCRIYLQSPVVSGYITAGIVDEIPVDGVSLVLGNVTVENMPGQTAPSTNHGNPPDPMPPKVSPVCVVTRSASRRMASNAPSEPHPSKTTIDPVVHCIEGTPVTRSTLIAEQARDPQLKALKECFLDESAAVPLAAYVKRFRERMCIAQRVASEKFARAQVKMKAHYDQTHKVQSREFHPVSSGHEESVDAVVDPVLRNSEVLQNPGEKLAHLPSEQAAEVLRLLQEHPTLFHDNPSLCPLLCHDVDIVVILVRLFPLFTTEISYRTVEKEGVRVGQLPTQQVVSLVDLEEEKGRNTTVVVMARGRDARRWLRTFAGITLEGGTLAENLCREHTGGKGHWLRTFAGSTLEDTGGTLDGQNWMDELPWVLLGIRTAPKKDLACSSAELVYVPLLRFRDISFQWRTGKRSRLRPSSHAYAIRNSTRTPFQRPYEGSFQVLQTTRKTFIIDYGARCETVSVDRLKPAHIDIDKPVLVAQPRRRVRPPSQPTLRVAQPAASTTIQDDGVSHQPQCLQYSGELVIPGEVTNGARRQMESVLSTASARPHYLRCLLLALCYLSSELYCR